MNPEPQTQQGLEFLRALRELMIKHDVHSLVGYDDGEVWINFNKDMTHDNVGRAVEPERFPLDVEELSTI